MSKKSIIQRQLKKILLVNKYFKKRKNLVNQIKNINSLENSYLIYKKIEKLPKNSCKIRLRNRCWKTGKGKSYYRFFGLCRNTIKDFANECLLPGLIKSSW